MLGQLDLKTFDRAPAPLAIVIPPTNKDNAACQALAMEALARGVDFDFALEDDKPAARQQRLSLSEAQARIDSLPALARPSRGYHLAGRRSGDGRQMLLYLRNVARMEDVGTGRPCWIRIVEPAQAWIDLPAAPTGGVRAYDLDEGRWIEAKVQENRITLAEQSEHDYVVIVTP